MLRSSAIGIAVIQKEGAAFQTFLEADIIAENILDALDMLNNTLRLKAT
jgi:soluble P-type ATPase